MSAILDAVSVCVNSKRESSVASPAEKTDVRTNIGVMRTFIAKERVGTGNDFLKLLDFEAADGIAKLCTS